MRSLDNQKKSYDVIIPVDKKNSKFVKNVVKYIRLNLPEANYIYLIANETLFKCLGGGVDNRCILIDENKMIPIEFFGCTSLFIKQWYVEYKYCWMVLSTVFEIWICIYILL